MVRETLLHWQRVLIPTQRTPADSFTKSLVMACICCFGRAQTRVSFATFLLVLASLQEQARDVHGLDGQRGSRAYRTPAET